MSAIRTPPATTAPPVSSYTPSPAQERCLEAFARDLPELLAAHSMKCVAYVNGERLRIADTQTELYRECLHDRGLAHEEFIVCLIAPDAGDDIDVQPR